MGAFDNLYKQAEGTNLNQPYTVASGFTPRLQTMFGDQKTEQTGFMDRLRGTIAGFTPLQAMSDRIGRELGIDNQRDAANKLRSVYQNIPYTVSSAAKGFDVNQNQADRTIMQRAGEMAPMVQAAEGALESSVGERDRRMGLEFEDQNRQLMPFEYENRLMMDRQAREQTGFTFAMETELNSIIDKVKNGVTLSEGERARANQLAQAKLSYDAAIKTAEISAKASKYGDDKSLEIAKLNSSNSADPLGLFS